MAKTLPQLLLAMERQGKLLQQLARISFSAASDPDEALRRIVAEGDTLKACVAEARDAFRCAAPESEGRVLVTDGDLKVIGEELARLATAAAALVRYVKEEQGQLQVARSLPPSRPEDHAALGASAVEAAQAEVRHQSTTVVDGVLAVQALLACNPSLDEVVAQPLRSRPRSRRNSPHRPLPSDSSAAGVGNGALVPQSAARSASTSSEGLSDAVATTSPPPRPRLKPNDAPGARPTETIGDVARQYGVTPAVLRRENPHLARFRDDTPLPRGTQVLLPEGDGGHGSPASDSAAAAGDERWFSAPPGALQGTAAAQGRNPALPEPAMPPVAESDEECLASVARSLGIPLAALLAANPQARAFDPQEPLPEGLTLTIPAPGTGANPTPGDAADAGPSPTTELFPPGASPASTEHRSPPQAQEAHGAHQSEPGALDTRDDAAGLAAPRTNGARYVYGDDEGHAPEPPLSVTPTAHSHRHGAGLDHGAHDEAPASPMGTIVAMTPPGPALSLEALSRALGQEPDLVRSLNPDLEDAVPPASPVTLPSPRTAMSPTRGAGAGPYPATSSDTLRQVAELYGLTTAQLRRANPQYHATADDAPLPLEYHIVLPALPPLAPRPEVPRDPSSSPGTYESPRDSSGIPPPSAAHDVPRRDRSALRHAVDEPEEGARAGAQDDGHPFAGEVDGVGNAEPAPDHVLYEAHAAGRDTFERGHHGASSAEEGHPYEEVPGGASSRGGVVSETRDADHGDGERHALPSHGNRGPHSMSSSRGQSAEPHAPQQSSSAHGRALGWETFTRDDERPPTQGEQAFGDQSHQGHADDHDSAPWERPQAQGGAARPAWVPRSATPSDASSSPDDIAADAGGDGADRAQRNDTELRQRGRLDHSAEEGHGQADAQDPRHRQTDASHGARASYPTASRSRDEGDRRDSASAADGGARSAGAEGGEKRGGASHGTHMSHGTSSSRGPSAEPHAPQRTADHNHTSGRDASARGDAALDGGSEDRCPSGSRASSRGPSAELHAPEQVSHRADGASGRDAPRFGGDRSGEGSVNEGQQYKAADPVASMEAGYTDASGPVARHPDGHDHLSHDAVNEERQADLPHGHRAAHGMTTRGGRADDAPSAHDAEGLSERDVEAVGGSEQQCGGETLGDVAYRAGVSESALRRCNPALSAHPPDQPLPPGSALATPDGGVVTARHSGPAGDTTDEEAPLEAYEAWKSPVSQPLEYGADAGPWAGTPKGSDAGRPPSPASPFSPRPGDATTPSQPSRGPGVRQAPSPTSTPLPRTSPRPPSRALSLEPAPMDGSGARSAWADHHEDQDQDRDEDHDHPAELLETVPTAAPPPHGSRPTTGSGASAGRGTAADDSTARAAGRSDGSVDAAGVTPPPRVPRGAALDGVVVSPATPVVSADPQPSLVRQPSHPSPEYLSKENDSLQQELVTARRHEDTLQSRLAALRQENDALRRLATQSERGTSPAQSSFSRELSEQPAWVPRPQPRPQPRTNSRIPSPLSQSQRRGSPGPAPGRAAVAAPNTARRPSPVGAPPRQAPMPIRRAPTPTPRGPPSSASAATVRPVRRDSAGAAPGDEDPSPAPAPAAATSAPVPARGPRAPSARRGSPALSAQPSLVRAGTAHRRSPSPPADPRANAPLPVQLENAILRKRLHDLHVEKARARRSLNPDRAVEALARATRFAPQTSPASRAEARARSGSPAVRGSPLRQGSPVRHGTKVPFYQQQQQQQPAGPRAPAAAPPRAASRERNARLSPSPSLLRREPSSAGRPASSVDNGRWIMPPGRASSPQ